jgi:dipeptidyl aminopeptidase/acylaminoacyl peptidase
MPWEDQAAYWRRSPLSLVGNVATPALVIVGTEDQRTPPSEAEQLYTALQLRGVPTALIRVPGAPHNLVGRPSQNAARVSAIIEWFDRYRRQRWQAPAQTSSAAD